MCFLAGSGMNQVDSGKYERGLAGIDWEVDFGTDNLEGIAPLGLGIGSELYLAELGIGGFVDLNIGVADLGVDLSIEFVDLVDLSIEFGDFDLGIVFVGTVVVVDHLEECIVDLVLVRRFADSALNLVDLGIEGLVDLDIGLEEHMQVLGFRTVAEYLDIGPVVDLVVVLEEHRLVAYWVPVGGLVRGCNRLFVEVLGRERLVRSWD